MFAKTYKHCHHVDGNFCDLESALFPFRIRHGFEFTKPRTNVSIKAFHHEYDAPHGFALVNPPRVEDGGAINFWSDANGASVERKVDLVCGGDGGSETATIVWCVSIEAGDADHIILWIVVFDFVWPHSMFCPGACVSDARWIE